MTTSLLSSARQKKAFDGLASSLFKAFDLESYSVFGFAGIRPRVSKSTRFSFGVVQLCDDVTTTMSKRRGSGQGRHS